MDTIDRKRMQRFLARVGDACREFGRDDLGAEADALLELVEVDAQFADAD